MANVIETDQIIKIVGNLQFVLYGVSVCIPVILALLGLLFKHFSKQFQKLEGIELLCYRVGEVEKFDSDIEELKKELTELKTYCETKNSRKKYK